MARIVLVHGVGHQFEGESSIQAKWYPALLDGVRLAGGTVFEANSLACPFYGDVFRPTGKMAPTETPYTATDLTAAESQLLELWWHEARRVDPTVASEDTKVRIPLGAQRALYALSGSRFFSGIAERALIGDAKQLLGYLDDPSRREISSLLHRPGV
jgi:hypothetical protein